MLARLASAAAATAAPAPAPARPFGQIRVHLAFIGHPLVSDGLYGGASAGGLERQALHAYSLALVHPATGEGMAWQSPLPQDMSDALDHWGMHYNET